MRLDWRGTVLLALVAFGMTRPGAVAAQVEEVPQGIVTGRVTNSATQQPISGAIVAIDGTPLSVRSDAGGAFRLPAVPPGVYSVTIRAIGYRPFIQSDVVVGSGKPYVINVTLTPAPIQLEAIEVRPSYFRPPDAAVTSTQSFGVEEVRRAPGVQEDVVRAVALFPGVGVTSGGRNDLIVRGGAPYENLFVVDGIEIPNINHFGSQGSTGGPLSLINIDFVQEAEFSSGGFGIKFGDRTASSTRIALRDGDADRLSGELNLSATSFGLIVEGPAGGRGSFLFSARRSYLDLLFKAAGFSFVPQYWDFTLKTAHPLGNTNRIEFLAIGALDNVTFFNETDDDRYDNSRILSPKQNQYFAGLTWKHFLDNGLLAVTLGRTFVDFRSQQVAFFDQEQEIFRSFSKEGENSLRANLVLEVTPRLELNVGNVTKFASQLRYDVFVAGEARLDQNGVPSPLAVDTSLTALRNATYAEASYYLTPTIRTTLGVRATYYDFLDASFRVDPRLGIRWYAGSATTLTLGAGRYHQAPSYIWLLGDPANQSTLDPIRADQVVAGVERELRADTKLQFEIYYKSYGRYPARVFRPQAVLAPAGFEDATTDIPFGLEPLTGDATGRSYGAELLVQKRLSDIPFYGLASLAVARSEFSSLEGVTRSGAYDGRVITNLVAGWRINRAWELSGKFRLATGLPSTPFIESGPNTGRLDFSQYNEGQRLPTFHALDIRIDRRWSFRGWQLDVYLDVQNVYGRTNISQYRWDFRTGAPEAQESLGVLPSIGVNVEF
jgi:hypothetical protein